MSRGGFTKYADLGWDRANYNITDRFADLHTKNMIMSGAAMGGALGGAITYTAAAGLGNGYKYKNTVEDIPMWEPKSNAYIGRAYKVPTSMESLQALHKMIVGKPWKRSAPRIFEWLMDSREERLKKSIRNAVLDGKADTSKLSDGELASLMFPYVTKKDRSVEKYLSIFRPYPIADGFIPRGLTKKDLNLSK